MSGTVNKEKNRKKFQTEHKAFSWSEKKTLADREEAILEGEIEDLHKWIDMIDTMNNEQLMEYLQQRPSVLRNQKSNHRKRAKRASKNKSPSSSGIMASVWKFHKEDEEENPIKPDDDS